MSARPAFRWMGLLALTLLTPPALASAEPAAGEPAGSSPMDVVEELHVNLLGVMKQAETLGYQGRHDQLAPVLTRLFDISYMAQKSVGRHWKSADEAKRKELTETFTRFTIANYAGRFDGYSGQSFETLGEEPSLKGTILVQTRLVDPNDDDVQLNYRLRQIDGSWRIIDVYLNGTVSEIALRRSEYSSLIQREGFDALLAALDEKISNLAAASPADQS